MKRETIVYITQSSRPQSYAGGEDMHVYMSHRWPQCVPLCRLFISVADATQQWFPEVLADELQTQR